MPSGTSGNSASPTDNNRKRQRSRKVCTNCRQNKAKCDADDRMPLPCTRCVALFTDGAIISCTVDPAFRRTRKRAADGIPGPPSPIRSKPDFRDDDWGTGFEQRRSAIRRTSKQDPQDPLLPTLPLSTAFTTISAPDHVPSLNLPLWELPDTITGTSDSAMSETGILGAMSGENSVADLLLHSDHQNLPLSVNPGNPLILADTDICVYTFQAIKLFAHFFETYHPYCPIFLSSVTAETDPSSIYFKHPLLFWSIITVACSDVELQSKQDGDLNLQTLHQRLDKPVSDMATQLSVKVGRSLEDIQALILLAEWPFSRARMKDERSWHYSTVAVMTGLNMGLHKPFHSWEYSSRPEGQAQADSSRGKERTLAWIYCHTLNYSMAAGFGLPSLVKDDWVVSQASAAATSSVADFPSWLRGLPVQQLLSIKVTRFGDKVACTLGGSPESATGHLDSPGAFHIWKALNGELNDIEASITVAASSTAAKSDSSFHPKGHVIVLARLLLARFRLACFGLQLQRDQTDSATRTMAMTTCYSTCVRLIDLATDTHAGTVLKWPRSVQFGVYVAALCLLRLIASEDGRIRDVSSVRRCCSALYRLVAEAFPDTPQNDTHASVRFLRILGFCAKDAKKRRARGDLYKTPSDPSALVVRTRMGAGNYFYDCLATAKRVRGFHESKYPEDPSIEFAAAAAAAAAARTNGQPEPLETTQQVPQPLPNAIDTGSTVFNGEGFSISEFDDLLASLQGSNNFAFESDPDPFSWLDNWTQSQPVV